MGRFAEAEASTMIVLDLIGAALVIAMLGKLINEDTRDNRIRLAR
jgi:hypothetical protein